MPDSPNSSDTTENPAPRTLVAADGSTIAYRLTPGKGPGVVFMTGFKSDMTGGKALALESLCRERGQAFLRFDYFGHGESSGKFEDGTIGRWAADAILALDRLTEGPQVLVGSSMGGWIMLLTALARPKRIAGLVGTAAAPDFTRDLLAQAFNEEQKREMAETGRVLVPNCYGTEPYAIARTLVEEGDDHLLLDKPIPIDVPVRLIHGTADADVPWRTSIRLAERLTSADVEVLLVKDGDHRLSEPKDLARLCRVVGALLDSL